MRQKTTRTLPGLLGAAAFCVLGLSAAHAASPVTVAVTPNPFVVSPGGIALITLTFTNNTHYNIDLIDGTFSSTFNNDGSFSPDFTDSTCVSTSFTLNPGQTCTAVYGYALSPDVTPGTKLHESFTLEWANSSTGTPDKFSTGKFIFSVPKGSLSFTVGQSGGESWVAVTNTTANQVTWDDSTGAGLGSGSDPSVLPDGQCSGIWFPGSTCDVGPFVDTGSGSKVLTLIWAGHSKKITLP